MSNISNNTIIDQIAETLEIPDSAYEKAEARYGDLGWWFKRPETGCYNYDPHIYSQGSFRLGTVVRPLNEDDEYDLDVGCRLRIGISKGNDTQKHLKFLVGKDLEAYRKARRIESNLMPMHRCWRIPYKDELCFHMDIVPSIPEQAHKRQLLMETMVNSGVAESLAQSVAHHAGSITDDRHPSFNAIALDWRISNSEGFALWFESRIKLANLLMEARAMALNKTRIDDLPARKWKSPLQRCVQILKRHRDVMFADNPDSKPISVILTTLAARAYRGEQELDNALRRILTDMGSYVHSKIPRVPNPVNPDEDFADKWHDPKYRHLFLADNFFKWLEQARADFNVLHSARNVDLIMEQASSKFGASLDATAVTHTLGLRTDATPTPSKVHIIQSPAKPWASM